VLVQRVAGGAGARAQVGGSEPGVLTLSYLATARTGQAYVASVLAENPAAPLAQDSAVLTLTAAVKGAFQLAAG
jgi:hypothetical protein